MKHPLKWEFPGGKLEENEDPEACLKREIKEELNLEIELIEQLPSNTHSYSAERSINLIPYRCRLLSSEIILEEHRQILWLKPEQLKNLDWAEADVPIVNHYIEKYK